MLDKYLIVDKIASGGMAEVFLARSTAAMGLGKFVAIKTILPRYSQQEDFVNMFRSEAKIAMQLQHRNLVNIYDFGVDKDQCYIVMELVQGMTLSQILKSLNKHEKIIPIPVALHVMIEAAAGLQYAHEITIHRDISPQNIMIGFQGDVKIIDFGVAKSQFEETQNGVLKGKIPYMSPEQIRGEKLDKRSDIFSLAVVLYEVLTNRRPFSARSEKMFTGEIPSDQVTWIQEINPAVDIELAVIIHKALNLNPDERFSTMDEFGNELRQYMQNKFPQFVPSEVPKFMRREFESNLQALQDKLFGFQFGKKVKDDKTETLPAVKVEKIKSILAEREAQAQKDEQLLKDFKSRSETAVDIKSVFKSVIKEEKPVDRPKTESPLKATPVTPIIVSTKATTPPQAPASKANQTKLPEQMSLTPETPLFTETMVKSTIADNPLIDELLEDPKKVVLVPKNKNTKNTNKPIRQQAKEMEDKTIVSSISKVSSVSSVSGLSQVTRSTIIRKKYNIKYAYQTNSELKSLYEMQSLHGQTKRGSEC